MGNYSSVLTAFKAWEWTVSQKEALSLGWFGVIYKDDCTGVASEQRQTQICPRIQVKVIKEEVMLNYVKCSFWSSEMRIDNLPLHLAMWRLLKLLRTILVEEGYKSQMGILF